MSSRTAQSSEAEIWPEGDPDSRQDQRRAETGTKVKDIDYRKLEQFMWTNPTLEQTALFFEVSQSTIARAIHECYALSFEEFRAKNLMQTKNALIQKAIQMAIEKDNVASLIFSLKNLAGWSDSMQMEVKPQQTIKLKYALDSPEEKKEIKDVTPKKKAPKKKAKKKKTSKKA